MSTFVARRLAVGLLAAATLLVVVLSVAGGRGGGHDVYVTVPKATGVLSGQYIRSAGSIVGRVADISPVDRGRAARLKLHLEDEAWPLPKGSRLTLRWGGTINLFNRYISLKRGPADAAAIADDGGDLPASAFRTPVEYGDLLKVFDKQVRADTKTLLDRGGAELDLAGRPLNRALDVAPPAVGEADTVLGTLADSRENLHTLVHSTSRVVDAIDTASPGLGQLIVAAGTTFNALASDVSSLQSTLSGAPGTLRRATATLRRADGTLRSARQVTDRLAPGVAQLRRIARPLNRVLGTLVEVGPDARATLATARTAAPDVTRVIARLTQLAPQLTSIGRQADVALNCIRPYTPEIASWGPLWGSALANNDGRDNYIRATPIVSLPFPGMASTESSGDIAKKYPGLTYGFPRPPGTQAGQPWFLPECGAGPDALDPSKDPEARTFKPADFGPPTPGATTKKGGR
ncbi:MAG: Long-chain-fatty-acid--CoA ligase [Solirubrobacterales bacterium]|nr:Long-chain-fatty-acid--CoA ligase [Solirubrobacterales bacterium]